MIDTRAQAIEALAKYFGETTWVIRGDGKGEWVPTEFCFISRRWYADKLAALVAAGVQTVNETMAQAVIDGKANDEIVKFWETMQESIPRQAEELLRQTISRLTAPEPGQEEGE